MDEMERMRTDISQMARRIDDFSLRLAVVETSRELYDEKLDSLKELFSEKMGSMQRSIEGWNKIGFWLLTAFCGAIIVGVVAFMLKGGFAIPPLAPK